MRDFVERYSFGRAKGLYRSLRTAIVACINLELRYGHYRTTVKWACIDKNGDPIPWYTYPAIEFLTQFDLRKKTVLEFGSGYSSLFWGKLALQVHSIEDNVEWYDKIVELAPENVKLIYCRDKEDYIEHGQKIPSRFDIISIDGSHRLECAVSNVGRLKNGGLFILDNSDWHPDAAKFLRESGYLQVDMHGFGPINPYTWTTSLFFDRSFDFPARTDRLPCYSVCALKR